MSKDKKKESNPKQELSEWQKRNQEYLKKKAEEEAALNLDIFDGRKWSQ